MECFSIASREDCECSQDKKKSWMPKLMARYPGPVTAYLDILSPWRLYICMVVKHQLDMRIFSKGKEECFQMKYAHNRESHAIIVKTCFPDAHLTPRKQGHLYPKEFPELGVINKVRSGSPSSGQATVQTLGALEWVEACLSKRKTHADRERELGRWLMVPPTEDFSVKEQSCDCLLIIQQSWTC